MRGFDIADWTAFVALCILLAIFGIGRGDRIERLWTLMRFDVLLLLAGAALHRLFGGLGLAWASDVAHRAQAVVLSICAARAVLKSMTYLRMRSVS